MESPPSAATSSRSVKTLVLVGSGPGSPVHQTASEWARSVGYWAGTPLETLLGEAPPSPATIQGAEPIVRRLLAAQGTGLVDVRDVVAYEMHVLGQAALYVLDLDGATPDLVAQALAAYDAGVPLWLVSQRLSLPPWLAYRAALSLRPEALRAALLLVAAPR